MSIALYRDAEGILCKVTKPAKTWLNEKTRKMEVEKPVFMDLPGRHRIFITKDNASLNGFPNFAEAIRFFQNDPDAGREYSYSAVLDEKDERFVQKPLYRLNGPEIVAEIKARTMREPKTMLLKESREALERLRFVAGQNIEPPKE